MRRAVAFRSEGSKWCSRQIGVRGIIGKSIRLTVTMIHTLNRTTVVKAPLNQVWDFIATPSNLNRITPENMSFEVISYLPEVMVEGLLIQYSVKIPLFGRWNWLTEIKHIQEGHSFVDEQRAGPYRFWYHYHEIQPHRDGTQIIDRVTYQMPFWLVGELVNILLVQRQLKEIFDFREKAFKQLLSG
jgi:ligand-binding SRPBCC domain-containing protein